MPTGTEAIFMYGALPASSSRGTKIADATTTSPNTTIASSRISRVRRLVPVGVGGVMVSVSSGAGWTAPAPGRGGRGGALPLIRGADAIRVVASATGCAVTSGWALDGWGRGGVP